MLSNPLSIGILIFCLLLIVGAIFSKKVKSLSQRMDTSKKQSNHIKTNSDNDDVKIFITFEIIFWVVLAAAGVFAGYNL